MVPIQYVWRQSWPGRLRLFVEQSVLLALLAAAIGWFAAKPALLVVSIVFLGLKAWIIPRILWRMASGTPGRPLGPRHSSGGALLAAGAPGGGAHVVIPPRPPPPPPPPAGAPP